MLWNQAVAKLNRLGKSHGRIESAMRGIWFELGRDNFAEAAKVLWELHEETWNQYGAEAEEARGAMAELRGMCEAWNEQLGRQYAALAEEQRQLLAVYAPNYPPQPIPAPAEWEAVLQFAQPD
jgi:hypothetical protein